MRLSWQELCQCSNDDLSGADIALVNHACAVGLPGYSCDVARVSRVLDRWAKLASSETKACYSIFEARRSDFQNSKSRFRAEVLVTFVQRKLGIRYDPMLIDSDRNFKDAKSLFLDGVVSTFRGTCTNLPVLYAAIGRRLGYPLKLVSAKMHRFLRWDAEDDSFNIESTSRGFVSHPDSHYLGWPIPTTIDESRRFQFLTPLTPREELARFMVDRGCCWLDNGSYPRAVEAFAWANELQPSCQLNVLSAEAVLNRWERFRDATRSTAITDVCLDRAGPFPNLPTQLRLRFEKYQQSGFSDDRSPQVLSQRHDTLDSEYVYTLDGKVDA